jgi:membrane dipeptidase
MNEARELIRTSDVIDLHIDSFIWTRVFGYRLEHRHGPGLLGGRFYSQVDLPRLREAGVGGAIWSITTNPLRRRRADAYRANYDRLLAIFARANVAVCTSVADYRAARATFRHAAFVGIQGGNAIDGDISAAGDALIRVTLVHLSTSTVGSTSAPSLRRDGPLSASGKRLVEELDARRIFVDLAHINRRGFFDALDAHDRTLPVMVSHTGVTGVTPHWRNVDDEQLRAVAATGGVVGIIYQVPFVGRTADAIVAHLQHVIDVAGEDTAALGSDWDGMIVTPRDMPTCLELPVLVDRMLARRWSPERIRKVLGGNFLRALAQLRGR